METIRRQNMWLMFTVLFGFAAGSMLPELLRMGAGDYAGLLSLYSLEKYKDTTVSAARLFPYILAVRLPVLLFLWMSSYTAAGLLFHLGYAWWLAASAGLLLSVFTLRAGYGGIVLFGCCIFPQWIVYVSMWRQEFGILFRRMRGTRSLSDGVLPILRGELVELARLAALCFFGCAAEAFLGIWTLQLYLRFF